MASNSSFEPEIEELRAVLNDLNKRFELVQHSNDQISASNSSLSEIIASIDFFKNDIQQFIQKISKNESVSAPEREEADNFQNEIISYLNFAQTVILAISHSKVHDAYTKKQINISRSVFEKIIDLTKFFFSFRKIPIPKLSQKTIRALTEPLDPMRFTQLFSFPEDFTKRSSFEQCCAFQAFDAHLDNLLDVFSQHLAVLSSKYDDTKTNLLYPQIQTLKTFPKFTTLVSLHTKLRQEMSSDSQLWNNLQHSSSKIFNILVQIKNRLNNTSQFFTRSINVMKEDTLKSREKYVSTCLTLTNYRAAEQITETAQTRVMTQITLIMLRNCVLSPLVRYIGGLASKKTPICET